MAILFYIAEVGLKCMNVKDGQCGRVEDIWGFQQQGIFRLNEEEGDFDPEAGSDRQQANGARKTSKSKRRRNDGDTQQ